MIKKFYVDTCIWLNLFKKEGDSSKGVPYWKIASDFISKIENSQEDIIIVSTIILKELKYKLDKKFNFVQEIFKAKKYVRIIKTTPQDYDFARKIEKDCDYIIRFYDCLHISLSKRNKSILITRDKDLIKIGKEYVEVEKPENLLI